MDTMEMLWPRAPLKEPINISVLLLAIQHWNRCPIVTLPYCQCHIPTLPLTPVPLLSCKPLIVISWAGLNVSLCLRSLLENKCCHWTQSCTVNRAIDSPQMNGCATVWECCLSIRGSGVCLCAGRAPVTSDGAVCDRTLAPTHRWFINGMLG